MAGICLPLGLCKGNVYGFYRNSHQSCMPTIHCNWGNLSINLGQPITKDWCRPNGGYVSYPIDSFTATSVGLFSSLVIAHLKDWHTYSRHNSCDFDKPSINLLHAKFFRRNKNLYLNFMSFLHIDMAQVLEILPQVRQELTYSTWSISWVLTSWRCK